MSTILIRNGRIIDPASGLDSIGDLMLEHDRIASIHLDGAASPAADEIIDADGCIVAPGLLDIHVHFRDPHHGQTHDETIATGSAAAVAGGFTTVCCMPNTAPALDNVDEIEGVLERGRAAANARVHTVGCGTIGRHGDTIAPIDELIQTGAIGISDDGDGIADDAMMRRILEAVAAADTCFMQHCQDPATTKGSVMNAGPLAMKLGLRGWPASAEEAMLERDLRINADINARYHAQHLSSGGSVELIRAAQATGQPATGEASPHHLLLTEDACATYDTHAKMNPPLRRQQDIDALKQGIADGIITILATDHAPHPAHTKAVDFASASFGIVGLECALPLYCRALIESNVIDWPAMLAMMTCNPARLVGLDAQGIGSLQVGGPADITIIDPDLEWTIDASTFRSTGRNCPFDGWPVRGRATTTIVQGMVKYALNAAVTA
jgi:dihydroorotase